MQLFCFQRNKRRFGNIWLISSTLIDFFNHFNYSESNPALSYGIIVWLVSTNVRFDAGFKRTSSDWAKPTMIIFTATSRSYWKNRKNDSYVWLNQCMTAKSAGELLWVETKTSPKFVWQTLWKEKKNWNYHFLFFTNMSYTRDHVRFRVTYHSRLTFIAFLFLGMFVQIYVIWVFTSLFRSRTGNNYCVKRNGLL